MCFQIDGKSAHASKCVKSTIITKVIDYSLSVDKFEHQYLVPEVMLQSPRLKYNMKTIGIDQSFRNSTIFEHRCLKNISKLYL